jgi:hypothetical protein
MGERRFDGSDFTKAVWRGATFLGTDSLADQFKRLREFFDDNEQGLAYLYWPTLDRTGHSSGVNSEAWIRRLEDLDQELRQLDAFMREDEGLIITADHGMVDVSDDQKLMVPESSALLHSVAAWGGEPRVAQLYLEDLDATSDVVGAWRETLGDDALVLARSEAIDAQLFGPVADEVLARIGDVLVLALEDRAFYRSEIASFQSMRMVGQHGSVTPAEREVPVIPLGAWA